MAYKPKSLSGATRRVRELERQIAARDQLLDRWKLERRQLAKLAATGPAFSNPLEAMEAEKLRDGILTSLGMRPDGTFK